MKLHIVGRTRPENFKDKNVTFSKYACGENTIRDGCRDCTKCEKIIELKREKYDFVFIHCSSENAEGVHAINTWIKAGNKNKIICFSGSQIPDEFIKIIEENKLVHKQFFPMDILSIKWDMVNDAIKDAKQLISMLFPNVRGYCAAIAILCQGYMAANHGENSDCADAIGLRVDTISNHIWEAVKLKSAAVIKPDWWRKVLGKEIEGKKSLEKILKEELWANGIPSEVSKLIGSIYPDESSDADSLIEPDTVVAAYNAIRARLGGA